MHGHNYGATCVAIQLALFNSLRPDQQKMMVDLGRQAQGVVRKITEDVDSEAIAKKELESRGMTVNVPNRAPFLKVAQEKIWPNYQKNYGELWDQIVATKV